ncbi:hypothetical protein BGZ49_003280 [Haplosporangium sp. Z 27]|nr:hypothetical protein BGZ49_003280 [Haplosporangium sp. Z 27]
MQDSPCSEKVSEGYVIAFGESEFKLQALTDPDYPEESTSWYSCKGQRLYEPMLFSELPSLLILDCLGHQTESPGSAKSPALHLKIGNCKYSLAAIIYGSGSHFCCKVFIQESIISYDGLRQPKLTRLKTKNATTPQGYIVNQVWYLKKKGILNEEVDSLSEVSHHEDSQDEYSSEASHQEVDQGNSQVYDQEVDQGDSQVYDQKYDQGSDQEYQEFDQECQGLDQEYYDQGFDQEYDRGYSQEDGQEYNQHGPSSEASYQARSSSNASNQEVNEKSFSKSNRQYFEESFPDDVSREEPTSKSLSSTSAEDVDAFDGLKEPFVKSDLSTSDDLVLLQTHPMDPTCASTHRGAVMASQPISRGRRPLYPRGLTVTNSSRIGAPLICFTCNNEIVTGIYRVVLNVGGQLQYFHLANACIMALTPEQKERIERTIQYDPVLQACRWA